MKVLIVGNGGREHAIAWKIYNEGYKELFCIPGNAGIGEIAQCADIKVNEFEKIRDFCIEKGIDFVVIGPDNPLADGIVDYLEFFGIKTFGPTKDAAMIESSKAFAKDLMKKYGIKTARYEVFTNIEDAVGFVNQTSQYPVVIKADGLALGKGVIIANNQQEAIDALNLIMREKVFGAAGDKVIIEDYLLGEEVSVFVVSDGKDIVPLTTARDHKKAFDGDKGPNTGGMGAFSPSKLVNKAIFEDILENIMLRAVYGMRKERRPFKGVLYGGLILTEEGPKVLEFNARFGDPEAQAILPLMKSELMEIMVKAREGNLRGMDVKFEQEYSLCVVLASKGYPDKYDTGFEISGFESLDEKTILFHANTKKEDGKIKTAGGRVLNVVRREKTLKEAKEKVYEEIKKIHFENMFYRTDIGDKEIE
ncbi:phosphoribosylamine--glycine ligase [Caldicellulosiruptor bescii]|uniref:Phosphoribosylamine--glycine ligase n=2 Tax=Caldicellulosiruptor bescii TaxID=31899 RepID=B9MS88_CALBD|nr:phosphoribosylamine--glycine ligase [Caldicellulosiruptor bescii]ACM60542.1 phosphoribosylamine/glycine ligase [Caldicellulosiruptor bescii DSM 6725]PBC87953.1 phosphoribosylamine--glycine ligase [Caldicellulosiruptor bescii]PBC90885.1 phosphoribosylamine--glycine ligase [Caldicellulosiruptor bescii]PBD03683.1 phosphoribosylamine--glycine ligase [Caldicellulosiruptor bescii]PBD06683.1 phosphoribosylamine--glycine ligase [Caldicellulosiruptor bescii]